MDYSRDFIQLVKHPVKFRIYLLSRLPSAFFSGVRIREMDGGACRVSVPYKWFSKNPFHSTYFACLSMAAEMSTGALAMAHLYKHDPPVSMLVVKMEANYFKKAAEVTTFTCTDGLAIRATIEKAVTTGEAQSITAKSAGTNPEGELVASFLITWSFKVKKRVG
jgi:hypothetical protein